MSSGDNKGTWVNPNKDRPADVTRHIPGEGPVPCDIMFIGERPGKEESWSGHPFWGPSGKLMDQFLRAEGLWRGACYITNIVKYAAPNNERPTAAEIRRDAGELHTEIGEVNPSFIALVGATAVHYFLPGVDLEWGHGMKFTGNYNFIPVYHPAFGLRSPESLPLVQDDFHWFAEMAKGHEGVPVWTPDQYPKPDYKELTDHDCDFISRLVAEGLPEERACAAEGPESGHNSGGQGPAMSRLRQAISALYNGVRPRTRRETRVRVYDATEIRQNSAGGDSEVRRGLRQLPSGAHLVPIYIDTEGYWWQPWGLSFCLVSGQAFVIHKDSKKAIKAFAKAIAISGRRVYLHNSLHDIEVLQALGIEGYDFIDTMIQAYHLCIEPQGLKPLARRYAGMDMSSYEEIVRDADTKKMLTYLEKVQGWAEKWQSKQSTSASPASSKTSGKKAKKSKSVTAGIKSQTTMKFPASKTA